jgi:hypothetical protein
MKKFSVAAVVLILLIIMGFFFFGSGPEKKPFNGAYAHITHGPQQGDMSFDVFATAVGGRKIFTLDQGDECFFLTDKEWSFMDAKDGSIYVPVFCPRKGGGWGYLSTLNEFKALK